MVPAIAVFIGAGIGGVFRHFLNILAARLLGTGFPYGTLGANLIGGLVMGLFIGAFARWAEPPQALRLFLTTGLLGGFTTFSTFSLDAVTLWERGAMGSAALYVAISVAGAIGGVVLGMALIRMAWV